jgi:ectoine hydroxylase-related dioxygenase (phytanoyl-CoA dioxygenase family)
MTTIDLASYQAHGYALIRVLDAATAEQLRAQIDAILLPEGRRVTGSQRFHPAENQHAGDAVETYGALSKHYYFHLLTDERFLGVQHLFHHPRILQEVSSLLGEALIINNASLFAAEPGTCYRLGWHRDVIQIPQEDLVEEAIYRPDRFHNSVQVNLPLIDDETLWVVPGSHLRPNTAAEKRAFQGSKHYAPVDAVMPGGVPVRIPAGHAVLYNNNLIHCGVNPRFQLPRRSLHLGYHGEARPPTWHFYLLNEQRFTPEYLAQMTPEVRSMIAAYFRCRARYPRMEDTWAFCRESLPGAPRA